MSTQSKNNKSELTVNFSDLIELKELHLDTQFTRGINFEDRIIILSGTIDQPMFDNIEIALTIMENEDAEKPVTIKINSPGGSVDEALAIVGRMKESKCVIETKGYGAIMSAATLILAAGDKGHRHISKYARFMHHCSSYEVDTTRHSEMKDIISAMEKDEEAWASNMAELTKKTNKSKKFWKEQGSKKDAYFNAKDLVRLGVVDDIF